MGLVLLVVVCSALKFDAWSVPLIIPSACNVIADMDQSTAHALAALIRLSREDYVRPVVLRMVIFVSNVWLAMDMIILGIVCLASMPTACNVITMLHCARTVPQGTVSIRLSISAWFVRVRVWIVGVLMPLNACRVFQGILSMGIHVVLAQLLCV